MWELTIISLFILLGRMMDVFVFDIVAKINEPQTIHIGREGAHRDAMKHTAVCRIFLLSPAYAGGERAQ